MTNPHDSFQMIAEMPGAELGFGVFGFGTRNDPDCVFEHAFFDGHSRDINDGDLLVVNGLREGTDGARYPIKMLLTLHKGLDRRIDVTKLLEIPQDAASLRALIGAGHWPLPLGETGTPTQTKPRQDLKPRPQQPETNAEQPSQSLATNAVADRRSDGFGYTPRPPQAAGKTSTPKTGKSDKDAESARSNGVLKLR